MNRDINLIQGENKTNISRKNKTVILRWISLVFLFFVAFFSILLFILSSRLSIKDVKNSEAQTLQKILVLKDKSAKYNLLNDRLKIIVNILNTRAKYTVTLNTILEQMPPNVLMKSLVLDKNDISLSANSSSLLSLNSFLNNMTKITLEKHVIKDISIEGLTVDKQTGTYSLSLKAKTL